MRRRKPLKLSRGLDIALKSLQAGRGHLRGAGRFSRSPAWRPLLSACDRAFEGMMESRIHAFQLLAAVRLARVVAWWVFRRRPVPARTPQVVGLLALRVDLGVRSAAAADA
jgi:hypothetical protein